jgi:hypothetical protein
MKTVIVTCALAEAANGAGLNLQSKAPPGYHLNTIKVEGEVMHLIFHANHAAPSLTRV